MVIVIIDRTSPTITVFSNRLDDSAAALIQFIRRLSDIGWIIALLIL